MDIILAVILSLAVVYDLRERRIPNALTIGGTFAALTLRLVIDPALATSGLVGAALGLVFALALFLVGAFGAGDGKLLVAVGAFLGLEGMPTALLAIGVAGGVMALADSWRRGMLGSVLISVKDLGLWYLTFGLAGKRRKLTESAAISVPYGPAIAAGAAFVWATGWTLR